MTKILFCLVWVFVVVLVVSVWQQLNPTTQHQIVLLWNNWCGFWRMQSSGSSRHSQTHKPSIRPHIPHSRPAVSTKLSVGLCLLY